MAWSYLSAWYNLNLSYCCAVRGFSARGFKFLIYGTKFVSERCYFPSNYRILLKLTENIHYQCNFYKWNRFYMSNWALCGKSWSNPQHRPTSQWGHQNTVPFFLLFLQYATHPIGSLWRHRSRQSFNMSTHFYFLYYSLHVSAPTGHTQVRYTIRYLLMDYF
jgi:hypothetical protein